LITKLFISRTLKKGSPLLKSLKHLNLTVIDKSLVEFSPLPFASVPPAEWMFFYSKNGVKFFFEGLDQIEQRVENLDHRKWAAIGAGTAKILKKHVAKVDFIGTGQPGATAAKLLDKVKSEKILFVRARQSKMSVQRLLKNRMNISDLIVYDNFIKKDFTIPACNFLLFTSPLNATAYFQKYHLQAEQKVLAIGNTTAEALHNLGISEVHIAKAPSEKAMANLILKLI